MIKKSNRRKIKIISNKSEVDVTKNTNNYEGECLMNIKQKKATGEGSRPRVITLPNYLIKMNGEKIFLDSKILTYKKQMLSIQKKISPRITALIKMETKLRESECRVQVGIEKKRKKKMPELRSIYIKNTLDEYSSLVNEIFDTHEKYKIIASKFPLDKMCEFVEYMNSK